MKLSKAISAEFKNTSNNPTFYFQQIKKAKWLHQVVVPEIVTQISDASI